MSLIPDFSLRTTTTPETGRSDVTSEDTDSPAASDVASVHPGPAAPTPPAPGPGESVDLYARVIELATEVMPDRAPRNMWLVDELVSLGHPRPTTSAATLDELGQRELLTLVERLAIHRYALARAARRRGHWSTPGSST